VKAGLHTSGANISHPIYHTPTTNRVCNQGEHRQKKRKPDSNRENMG
jgi:hypothetical protein